MIGALYERLTGKPWITVRSAAAEFGPPPGAIYADHLARFTDGELVAHHTAALNWAANQRQARRDDHIAA